MKVVNLKHVSIPSLLFGARLQTVILPLIVFYLLLIVFLNWNISIVGMLLVHSGCVYLTQKDMFLIEVMQAVISIRTKKANRRESLYGA